MMYAWLLAACLCGHSASAFNFNSATSSVNANFPSKRNFASQQSSFNDNFDSTQSTVHAGITAFTTIIIVSVVVPVIVIIAGLVGFCFWRRRRRQRQTQMWQTAQYSQSTTAPTYAQFKPELDGTVAAASPPSGQAPSPYSPYKSHGGSDIGTRGADVEAPALTPARAEVNDAERYELNSAASVSQLASPASTTRPQEMYTTDREQLYELPSEVHAPRRVQPTYQPYRAPGSEGGVSELYGK